MAFSVLQTFDKRCRIAQVHGQQLHGWRAAAAAQ
jgi:hypothetical protein